MKEIFDNFKNITVIGMSKNPFKAAHTVPAFMSKQGYEVVPVNPTVDEIIGLKCYKTISEVPNEIEILNVFRPSEDCPEIIREAIQRKRERGDIKLIWLQEGIFSVVGSILAESEGIEFIQDKCIYKEYINC